MRPLLLASTCMAELRYLAARAGGNGITNYMCHSAGVDMGSNCWNSTARYADAIVVGSGS
jgi:hypothetical protein